jgi:hypothetical protein
MLSPVVWCLPEYSSGWSRHDQQGSSVPSTRYWVCGSRSSAVGTKLANSLSSTGVSPVMARLIVDWETPKASASSAWARFLRK